MKTRLAKKAGVLDVNDHFRHLLSSSLLLLKLRSRSPLNHHLRHLRRLPPQMLKQRNSLFLVTQMSPLLIQLNLLLILILALLLPEAPHPLYRLMRRRRHSLPYRQ